MDLLTGITRDGVYTAISSDAIGNTLSDGTRTYTWRNGRELATLTKDNVTWSYTYNADGMRTKRTNGTTTYRYFYAGSQLTQFMIDDYNIKICYDEKGLPMVMLSTDGCFYYVTNIQGDVIGLIDSAGELVVQYEYDPWGSIVSITGSMANTVGMKNPLRYRGYVYDDETGLYYLQSRYYNPDLRRFINADKYISGASGTLKGYNLFAYCFNNPVNMRDVSGNWPEVVEELGSRMAHWAKIMGRIVISPFKSITADVGIGTGLGVKASANVGGVPIEVSAVNSITDSVTYDKGKFDAKNSTSTHLGVRVAKVFDFSYKNGREHSYYDNNCSCSFMSSTFGEKSQCVANHNIISSDAKLGVSFGTYCLFGAEASISIDLAAWNDELISIYHESLSYGK